MVKPQRDVFFHGLSSFPNGVISDLAVDASFLRLDTAEVVPINGHFFGRNEELLGEVALCEILWFG